jgi:two-component system, NtrC family, sensor kinase
MPSVRPIPLEDPRMQRLARHRVVASGLTAAALSWTLVAWEWGQPRKVAFVIAVWLFVSGANFFCSDWLAHRASIVATEHTRATLNTIAWLSLAHVVGWALPVWTFVLFYSVLATGIRESSGRLRVGCYLAAWTVAACWDGVPWTITIPFVLLGVFAYWASDARAGVIEGMLAAQTHQNEALRQAQDELKVWHSNAVTQEKLTSLGMLAAGMAHEINNPMSFVTANVVGLIEDLSNEPELSPTLVEYRDDVLPGTMDGIRRVNAIIADLRRFSRGEREEQVEFDVVSEVEAALRMARAQLGPGQSLHADLAPVRRIVGMPRQIGQVVLNLVLNGLQALDGRGTVHVETRERDGYVEVTVRDSGRGMTEETRSHLFQPFFTTKKYGAGMGLGLAVVHGIVRAHGGRIEVESSVGRGSTFVVRLPLRCEVARPSAAA